MRTQRFETLVKQHPEIEEQILELLPSQNISVPELQDFAEDYIEARFERVPGISNSDVRGGREEELQVIVDPQQLAARRLTIYDIRNALRDENRDVSAGDLWEGKRRYVVRTLGRFRSAEQVGNVIVGQGEQGSPIYLRDVAEIKLGFKKPTVVAEKLRRGQPVDHGSS